MCSVSPTRRGGLCKNHRACKVSPQSLIKHYGFHRYWFHLWTSPLICFRNQRFTFRNCAVDMLMWSDICFLLCVLRILQIRGTCTEMQNVFDEVILLAEKWGHLGKGLSMRRFLSYKCIVQHFRHDLCKKWFSYSIFLSCFPVQISQYS